MPLENCNTATLQQRVQSGACSSYAERQEPRRSQRCNSECRAELAQALPSTRSLDEVNAAKASAERSSSYAERRSLVCTLHPTLGSVGSYAPGGETCEKDAGSVYAQDSALPLAVQETGV